MSRALRALLLLTVVWLAGAGVAVAVGLLAVRLVAAQVGDPAVPPVTAQAAAASGSAPSPTTPALTTAPPATTSAPSPPAAPPVAAPAPTSTTPTAGPAVTSAPRAPAAAQSTAAFTSAGGSVGVRCVGTTATVIYASPADGYGLDDRSAAGTEVEVRFEGGQGRVRLRVGCGSGAPELLERRTDGDSSGPG